MEQFETPPVTQVQLTAEQRKELGAALGINAEFVPSTLGVVALPSNGVRMMGLEAVQRASFSPAVLMM